MDVPHRANLDVNVRYRVVRNFASFLLLILTTGLLTACGGSGNGAAPPASASLTSSSADIGASTTDASASGQRGVAGLVFVTNPPATSEPLTVRITPVTGVEVFLRSASDVSAPLDEAGRKPLGIVMMLKPPIEVGPGVHVSTYAIDVCLDPACRSRLPTLPDPMIFTITYTVT